MLNPVPAVVTESLLECGAQEAFQHAVTSREPDPLVAEQDLAWWLGLQERLEIRADLHRAGLL
jgi:hypothetical protein